ncbi:unnamed protein product [Mesocestoides corti]|uniref:DAZ-associated protein 2 n=1 Tax=Mesocestoides corti TaxID=53468 RepID=A0A0R3U1S0_MESCO|nr:unnamed protein product [Mesocestoides corti]
MLQTLHMMHQPQTSTYDPAFRPLLQPSSGFGTLSANGGASQLTASGNAAAASSFYQPSARPPPPPDQPLPPLPPITPTSGMSCWTHRPSSTVNPYAASSAVSMISNGMNVGLGGGGAPMVASTHTGPKLGLTIGQLIIHSGAKITLENRCYHNLDGSMAEYASASLISGQTGYPMRPPSIHGGSGGLIFAPSPTGYPTAQPPTSQDVFLQSMLAATTNGNAATNAGVFPLMVSCSSGFGDGAMPPSLSVFPSHSMNGPFDTLKSIDTLPPHEDMR